MFEVDGAVFDLQQDGHRVAFNRAFMDLGFGGYFRLLIQHGRMLCCGRACSAANASRKNII